MTIEEFFNSNAVTFGVVAFILLFACRDFYRLGVQHGRAAALRDFLTEAESLRATVEQLDRDTEELR